MTVSAFAIAEPTFSNPQNLTMIPASRAVEVTAEYIALIEKVNATLEANKSGYSYEEVKAVSSVIVKKINSCKKGSYVETLDCKQNRADLTEVLTQDVIKSNK